MGQNSKMSGEKHPSKQALSNHSISEGTSALDVYLDVKCLGDQSSPSINLKVRRGPGKDVHHNGIYAQTLNTLKNLRTQFWTHGIRIHADILQLKSICHKTEKMSLYRFL